MADDLGIPFDESDNNRLRGVSRMESLEIVLEKSHSTYTEEQKAVFAAKKNDIYSQCGDDLCVWFINLNDAIG